MFFCKGNTRSINTLKDIISKYEKASGQAINKGKSAITFSRKMNQANRTKIKDILQITQEGDCGKYLGLPEQFGRTKKDLFTNIVERIHQKRINWTMKYLSPAGKSIMLKSVLCSLPTYAMTCFVLPSSICAKIQSQLTRFWWDSNASNKGMSWIAWSKLTQSKDKGGLGFREIHAFNLALVAKVSWRIITKPDTILSSMLRRKYCKDEDFLTSQKPSNISHAWKGIMLGRELIKEKIGWAVGNGESISIWKEFWLSTEYQQAPFGPPYKNQTELKVSDLINSQTKNWDIEKIEAILPEVSEVIQGLKLSRNLPCDKRIWTAQKTGSYTTKSGYYTALEMRGKRPQNQQQKEINWVKEVWMLKTSPKVKMFTWKCLSNAIAVGENLRKRQVEINPQCKRCGEAETVEHVMWFCPFAMKVWNESPIYNLPAPCRGVDFAGIWKRIYALRCSPPSIIVESNLAPWICWRLWKSRNEMIFNNNFVSEEETLDAAIKAAKEWEESEKRESVPDAEEPRCFETNPNTLVVYTDAAWCKKSKKAGIACVFMKNESQIKCMTSVLYQVGSPFLAEAMAMLEGVRQAAEENTDRVEFRSDSQTLINTIRNESENSEIYGILMDFANILPKFMSFNFTYVPRVMNKIADGKAKWALIASNAMHDL